jgi:hypothetical protein
MGAISWSIWAWLNVPSAAGAVETGAAAPVVRGAPVVVVVVVTTVAGC